MAKTGWQKEPARHGLAAKGVKTKHRRLKPAGSHPGYKEIKGLSDEKYWDMQDRIDTDIEKIDELYSELEGNLSSLDAAVNDTYEALEPVVQNGALIAEYLEDCSILSKRMGEEKNASEYYDAWKEFAETIRGLAREINATHYVDEEINTLDRIMSDLQRV